jgi:hypothetical protein
LDRDSHSINGLILAGSGDWIISSPGGSGWSDMKAARFARLGAVLEQHSFTNRSLSAQCRKFVKTPSYRYAVLNLLRVARVLMVRNAEAKCCLPSQ